MARVKPETIDIVGASANNLRDVSVSLPIGEVSMVVGVSGSGKSSLLKDTLAREGNLRLRTFLGISQDHLGPPVNGAFLGRMPPTLHLSQRAFRASSRTTVGTASGLLSLLRKMFVRWSVPVSYVNGGSVPAPCVDTYKRWLLEHFRGAVKIWAIPLSFTASDGVAMAKRLCDLGFREVIVRSETDSPTRWAKGKFVDLERFKPLASGTRHLVETEVGSVDLGGRGKAVENRLEELLSLAFKAGDGRVFVELQDQEGAVGLDSRRDWVSPDDPARYHPPSDHLLSFNAPDHDSSGACPDCLGRGFSLALDINKLIVRPDLSMHQGAFALWTRDNFKYVNIQHETIEGLRGLRGFDPDKPWSDLSKEAQQLIIDGAGSELIVDREPGARRKLSKPRCFEGFRAEILKRVSKQGGAGKKLAPMVREQLCPSCHGSRWCLSARALRLGGYSIDQILSLNFSELSQLVSSSSELEKTLPEGGRSYLTQLHRLAESFIGVGLAHISGDRGMVEISEGESRRLRLAATLDGSHSGLCLLLDEPARGLHDEDVDRLSATLASMRGSHSLILNEHRRRMAAAADHLIELGPGAGLNGGSLVYEGEVPDSWWHADSALEREVKKVHPNGPKLEIQGVKANNVSGVDVSIPVGHLVSVVGVSGSGKSSFVRGALIPGLMDIFEASSQATQSRHRQSSFYSISGTGNTSGIVTLDQRAPLANRRSTLATFIGVAERLRKYYAKLTAAKVAGLEPSDFGLNSGRGRCEQCLGIGELMEGNQWITCPGCGGGRFGSAVLSVLDNGYDIAQILDRSIASLVKEPFAAFDDVLPLLKSIDELGIGHLSLGRRLDTVSGGELQRLRIARELSERSSEHLMFVLDEPAAGLHSDDVRRLLDTLDHIVRDGHSVIIVEHNLELVAASDWVIEFGPGSGPQGGRLIAEGAPSDLRKKDTATGRMLSTTSKPKKPLGKATPYGERHIPCLAEAESAFWWLRRLLGDDVPPREQELQYEGGRPAVVVDPHSFGYRRLVEFGGLNRELASLALDCQRGEDSRYCLNTMLNVWEQAPGARLQVHPLVNDFYIWGLQVPASIVKGRYEKLTNQGLEWVSNEGLCQLRVAGGPLQCNEISGRSMRSHLIERAQLIGGGYVELVEKSRVLATYINRPVELEQGLVGPHSASANDFDRYSVRGQCVCCKGRGTVLGFDADLVIGDEGRPVDDIDFLNANARAVLRGVHRNILMPFFKRMIKEGLWPANRPISQLSDREKELLLHGFWCRPGAGSFLRTAKSDPKEVASWLRWEGLFAHVFDNANRGSREWSKALLASRRTRDCPVCDGIGLPRHASLLKLAGRSYSSWLSKGTLTQLYQALDALSPPNSRSERRKARLLEVLAPLNTGKVGQTRLDALLVDGPWSTLAPAVVETFTDMPALVKSEE